MISDEELSFRQTEGDGEEMNRALLLSTEPRTAMGGGSGAL